jgi:two-component system, OmpR family, response regulator MprA
VVCRRANQVSPDRGLTGQKDGDKTMHRILVVEDDPLFREILRVWLQKEGFEVVLAENLEAGFVNIAAEPIPEAVLLDNHLGHKNGLTLAHWARKQKHLAHILIVAMTGDDSLRDKKSVLDAGCDACLIKPFNVRALREVLFSLRVHTVR